MSFKILLSLFFLSLITFFICSCEKDPYEANSGTFVDKRDNREYNWVRIGEQVWMAENLAYIPNVCGPEQQCGIYVYGYEGTGPIGENYFHYGCLYSWDKAIEICPEGWHLPSDEEWMELELFLGMKFEMLDRQGDRGGNENVGGKLKETGSSNWIEPNAGATNETGFSALPGGGSYERFIGIRQDAAFWTASLMDSENSMIRAFSAFDNESYRINWRKSYGLSVRCIKN